MGMRRVRIAIALALAAGVLLATPAPADANVGTMTPYGAGQGLAPTHGVVVNPADGHVWFTDATNRIVELDPATGAITPYANAGIKSPSDITVAGGDIWFTNPTAGPPGQQFGSLGRFDPDTDTFTFYPTGSSLVFPSRITTAADGNLWVLAGSKAQRFLASNGAASVSIGTGGSSGDIISGPDENIWITKANGTHQLLQVHPTTGALLDSFDMPVANLQPRQLANGPDGRLWFTYGGGNWGGVARFDLGTDQFQRKDFTSQTNPKGITAGPDGNVWFLGETNDRVFRISTSLTGMVSYGHANLDIGSGQNEITSLDDDLWVAGGDSSNDRVFRVSTVPTCDGRAITVDLNQGEVPTAGADVILGKPVGETINALGGNDRICGGGGNDTINAGPGDDRAWGGAGNDKFNGSTGVDRLNGDAGNDTLNGNTGNDVLSGAAGKDRLNGGPNRDTCAGGPQRDSQSGCEVRSSIP
jgi:streptogramin lyase